MQKGNLNVTVPFLGLIALDEKIAEFIPNFLFKTFDSLLYQVMNYYQREIRGYKS